MADLLLIGGATDKMMARMADKFSIHKLADGGHPAEKITHVCTNGHDGIKPDVMASLPNLEHISCYGVGYDAIDTAEAVKRGIVVTHTPNVLNAEVATTAVLLMLACYREALRDDAYVRSGAWEAKGNAPLTRSADNQTIGILGLGRIGQARNKKDVSYKYYDDLKTMAADCDVLVCITPGGPATNKIVNADVLAALGPQGTLINVARGSVVDEEAMIAALQSGALANTVLLPHVGSGTVETRAAMGALTVDNLLQHLSDGTVISPVPECDGM